MNHAVSAIDCEAIEPVELPAQATAAAPTPEQMTPPVGDAERQAMIRRSVYAALVDIAATDGQDAAGRDAFATIGAWPTR